MEEVSNEKNSEVSVIEENVDFSEDEDGEEREGFDELFHRISISNSTIDFEYHVKNPFKTQRNVRFCLGRQCNDTNF